MGLLKLNRESDEDSGQHSFTDRSEPSLARADLLQPERSPSAGPQEAHQFAFAARQSGDALEKLIQQQRRQSQERDGDFPNAEQGIV